MKINLNKIFHVILIGPVKIKFSSYLIFWGLFEAFGHALHFLSSVSRFILFVLITLLFNHNMFSKRKKIKNLFSFLFPCDGTDHTKEEFLKMSGWDFEEVVAKIMKKAGFQNVKVTKGSGDGGVDIIGYKNNDKYIVQCKNYSTKIGAKFFRELVGVRDDFNADKLIMVASSGATKAAFDFMADKPDLILWTLDDLIEMDKKGN